MTDERTFRPPASGWVRDQLARIDGTGDTRSVEVQGRPVVVVEVLGARSGLWRRVPLMRVEHDGVYVAVASKGGAPSHPAWFHSITANPDVVVQDGTERHERRARVAAGDERAQWWARCVEAFPPYRGYQEKAGREIPVVLLEPR